MLPPLKALRGETCVLHFERSSACAWPGALAQFEVWVGGMSRRNINPKLTAFGLWSKQKSSAY